MSFKENLKSELQYQDIQLKELAAKTGISKNTLGNYLTGHNSLPSAENVVKIAQALNVSVEYLVTGKSSEDLWFSSIPVKERKIMDCLKHLDEIELDSVLALVTTLMKRNKSKTVHEVS